MVAFMKAKFHLRPPMNPNCRVVLVDDHSMFLTVFRDVMIQTGDYEVAGISTNGSDAIELCVRTLPDLVLLDMMLPGISGLELIGILRLKVPEAMLVALSGLATKEAIHMAILAGANSYIPKSVSVEQFLQTLQTLRAGHAGLSPDEAEALRWAVRERRMHKEISHEELEVLRLFAQGMPVKGIAAQTQRTESAVYKMLQKNKRRFALKNDWELRQYSERLGLAGYGELSA